MSAYFKPIRFFLAKARADETSVPTRWVSRTTNTVNAICTVTKVVICSDRLKTSTFPKRLISLLRKHNFNMPNPLKHIR